MSAGVPTRSWMPRSCDTDESSQSGIGDTELPSPISFKKSKGILINQEECAALTAARDVCVYSRRLDPSKFPCAPWNQQFYVNRYLNTDNYASLPRSWSKHLSKDPSNLQLVIFIIVTLLPTHSSSHKPARETLPCVNVSIIYHPR